MVAPLGWLTDLATLTEHGTPCVLVTVTDTKGSAPREAGTKMVVTEREAFGTIGGGNLELQAMEEARALLAAAKEGPTSRHYPLGPSLAQCCGGAVTILLEPFLSAHKTVLLFGAGHVGREIASVLSGLLVRVRWIDEREDEFSAVVPANVTKCLTGAPVAEMAAATSDDFVLIVTHSHDLDYELVRAAFAHGRFAYLGLIGSKTKRARFERRLLASGVTEAELSRLVCPIGLSGITGKHPREIAIAVAGQLLQLGLTRP